MKLIQCRKCCIIDSTCSPEHFKRSAAYWGRSFAAAVPSRLKQLYNRAEPSLCGTVATSMIWTRTSWREWSTAATTSSRRSPREGWGLAGGLRVSSRSPSLEQPRREYTDRQSLSSQTRSKTDGQRTIGQRETQSWTTNFTAQMQSQ